MTIFQYDAQIIANYPHLVSGVIIADGLSNPPTPDALREQYAAEQAAVKARIGDTPLSEIKSISAWRSAISAFGVSPTKYRSAAYLHKKLQHGLNRITNALYEGVRHSDKPDVFDFNRAHFPTGEDAT